MCSGAGRGQKGALEPLELESQLGTEPQSSVNGKCSQLLSQLSNPRFIFNYINFVSVCGNVHVNPLKLQ